MSFRFFLTFFQDIFPHQKKSACSRLSFFVLLRLCSKTNLKMASFLFEEECKSYLLPELEAPNEHTEVEYDEYDNVKPPHAFPVALLDSQNKINECYTSYLVAWSLLEDGTMADASARTAFISMVDSCPDTLV